MTTVTHAKAYANNEVALIAWSASRRLDGCLGFEILRQYLDASGNVTESIPLAAFVAFEGQSNPDWKAQNTSVWPVQKFFWRDLTLRKRRDSATRRPDEVTVRYHIRPVAEWKAGMDEVVPRHEEFGGVANTYQGAPLRLGYMDAGLATNAVFVTRKRGEFESTFTNGILSGQWLSRSLTEENGKIDDARLQTELKTPNNDKRNYLSGDVLELIRSFFGQTGGHFYMALYEFEDAELERLVTDNASRISLILSNTGQGTDSEDADDDGNVREKLWDDRNRPARQRLMALAEQNRDFELIHRMFNNSTQIGHNKFVVWVDDNCKAKSLITGSLNWTWSGLTAQSNNSIRIDMPELAGNYFTEWQRLKADPIPLPAPLGKTMSSSFQGAELRSKNAGGFPEVSLASGTARVWFSPNMAPRKYPAKDPATPPDLDQLFSLMRKAKDAIFFLVFYPAMDGRRSIVEEAVNLGKLDKSLLVIGAVSAEEALPNFVKSQTLPDGTKTGRVAPFTYQTNKVSVVRAAALGDRELHNPMGNFQKEVLKPKEGIAIIHDKIVVIDPLDPENCVVAFGSHNLGFKASYSNDENLVIVRGHKALAEAYAVHVMDIYDHYRFRAWSSENAAKGGKAWDGFLSRNDQWQDHASTDISNYFAKD